MNRSQSKGVTMPNPSECPGHPCEDAADLRPHAGIGEVFYCDGSCQGGQS